MDDNWFQIDARKDWVDNGNRSWAGKKIGLNVRLWFYVVFQERICTSFNISHL